MKNYEQSKSCQIVAEPGSSRRDDIDWVLPSSVKFVKAAEVLKGLGLPKICVHESRAQAS